MQPITAISLVLGGSALLAASNKRAPKVLAIGLAGLVLLAGLQALAQFVTGFNFGIDRLFFPGPVSSQTVAIANPGRMAEPTAISFTLIGIGLLLAHARTSAAALTFSACATAILLMVAATLLGYLFQAAPLSGIFGFTHVALHTAIGLGALAVGLLALRPDAGWVRLLTGMTVGATAARRLLPLVVLVPVAVAWLALQGSEAGYYPGEIRLALTTTITVAMLVGLTVWTATRLNNLAAIRRTEQALRDTERRLNAVLDNASVAIFALDERQHCSYMNAAAEKLTGYTLEETAGRPLHDVIHHTKADGSDFPLEECAIDRAFPENHREQGEETFIHRDGSFYPVAFTASPLHDENLKTTGTIVEVRNIAEERALESQLRHVQRMDAIGQLTGGIAHDFNNILAIVMGNLDLLREQAEDGSEAAEMSDEALGAATRGAELVRRLLAFARKQHLEPAAVDLNERLPEITALLRRTLGESIKVHVQSAPELWSALVDPTQVDDALVNLAINARDAMKDGGSLSIETNNVILDADYCANNDEITPGEYVMLVVSDTGSGMAPEVAARAFEPFYTTKGEGQGTGLGLSQVYGWVKQSEGHIKIYSEVGHGTTIRLYLPRADADPNERTGDHAKAFPAPGGDERIFVVEDNPGVRNTVVRQLKDLGYSTMEAEDAHTALEMIEAGAGFDLLLTDVVMPGGMTGYELADRAGQLRPDLKVLFTSGYTELAVGNGKTSRKGHLLSKPYRKQDLGLALRGILDGTAKSPSHPEHRGLP